MGPKHDTISVIYLSPIHVNFNVGLENKDKPIYHPERVYQLARLEAAQKSFADTMMHICDVGGGGQIQEAVENKILDMLCGEDAGVRVCSQTRFVRTPS